MLSSPFLHIVKDYARFIITLISGSVMVPDDIASTAWMAHMIYCHNILLTRVLYSKSNPSANGTDAKYPSCHTVVIALRSH